MEGMLKKLAGGLIVSCYAGGDINPEMAQPETMACVAKSCVVGGAAAIRTNLENVKAIRKAVDVPLIGIKKIYRSGDVSNGNFRITPTLREVEALVNAGADGIAIDGTRRERYDNLTLEDFIKEIKRRFNTFVVADVSTVEEGVVAWKCGADMVGTTLSGYTPYSKNPIRFGEIPTPPPDYEIVEELRRAGVEYIIAEGRITDGKKLRRALESGAHSVVIGTSITEPCKIVKTILLDAK